MSAYVSVLKEIEDEHTTLQAEESLRCPCNKCYDNPISLTSASSTPTRNPKRKRTTNTATTVGILPTNNANTTTPQLQRRQTATTTTTAVAANMSTAIAKPPPQQLPLLVPQMPYSYPTPIQQQQPYYYPTQMQQQQPYYYLTQLQQQQQQQQQPPISFYIDPQHQSVALPRVKLNQNECCCVKYAQHLKEVANGKKARRPKHSFDCAFQTQNRRRNI